MRASLRQYERRFSAPTASPPTRATFPARQETKAAFAFYGDSTCEDYTVTDGRAGTSGGDGQILLGTDGLGHHDHSVELFECALQKRWGLFLARIIKWQEDLSHVECHGAE